MVPINGGGMATCMERDLPILQTLVPKPTRAIMLEGCGHWTQQERPGEVNAALIEFLRSQPLERDTVDSDVRWLA